jgi:RNA polymerase sigma-70 factor (ECF subfamily)
MLRYQRGDVSAFDQLFRRHRDPVYRYLVRGCSDREKAAEMFQDVWASVVRVRATWEPRAKFTTWLYRLAHNRLVDDYRLARLSTEPLEDDVPVAAPAHLEPEAATSGGERLKRVLDAVARLPFEQREAFLLKEEGGLSLEEIAQATGVGRETVKSRLRYALAKLREELRDVV